MSKIIKIKKGLDINLQGKAEAKVTALPMATSYAVSPLDFEGVVPKLLVKAGEQVKAGDALFFSKNDSRVLFTSPVSGTVTAVNRGEKRKVLNVTVQPDATQSFKEFTVPAIEKASKYSSVFIGFSSRDWPLKRSLEMPNGAN